MKKAGRQIETERTGMLQASQAEWIIGRFRGAVLRNRRQDADFTDDFGAGNPRVVHS